MSDYADRLRKWATKVQEMARDDKLPPDSDAIPWSAMVLDLCEEHDATRAHVSRLEESLRVALEARAEAVEVVQALARDWDTVRPRAILGPRAAAEERISAALAQVLGRGA